MGQKIDTTIGSKTFRDGVIKIDGTTIVDMRGDPRIDEIVKIVKAEMDLEKNQWKAPQNEKQICEKISEVMHRKEFYGPYNTKSSAMQEKLASVHSEVSTISLNMDYEEFQKRNGMNRHQLEEKLEKLKAEEKKLKSEVEKDAVGRNVANLKGVKSGETVCFHQAAIMSRVMDKLGMENDLCLGVHDGDVSIGNHAFVQSQENNKAIIDATAPHVYWYNDSGGTIRNGDIVSVCAQEAGKGEGGAVATYGAGKFPSWIERRFADKYLLEQFEQDKPKTPQDAYQSVLWANQHRAEKEPAKKHLSSETNPEVVKILESLNKGWFGKDTISLQELNEGKDKLSKHQIEVLTNAGVYLDRNTIYDISDARHNSGANKGQHTQENSR